MFYVSEGKIYGREPDVDEKYIEYQLVSKDDMVFFKATGNKISSRPVGCQVCSAEEVLAQLSGAAVKAAVATKKSKY